MGILGTVVADEPCSSMSNAKSECFSVSRESGKFWDMEPQEGESNEPHAYDFHRMDDSFEDFPIPDEEDDETVALDYSLDLLEVKSDRRNAYDLRRVNNSLRDFPYPDEEDEELIEHIIMDELAINERTFARRLGFSSYSGYRKMRNRLALLRKFQND